MANANCPKCKGTGRVKDKNGVHTCWDCLKDDGLDQHSKNLKEANIQI